MNNHLLVEDIEWERASKGVAIYAYTVVLGGLLIVSRTELWEMDEGLSNCAEEEAIRQAQGESRRGCRGRMTKCWKVSD